MSFDWSNPYRTVRIPVFARNTSIATLPEDEAPAVPTFN